LLFFIKGDKFTDPIDGKSFKSMLPYGYETQRNNVLSPSTLSLETSFIVAVPQRTLIFYSAQKVLHFAPEQAFINYSASKKT
jgi:hypothetical protein